MNKNLFLALVAAVASVFGMSAETLTPYAEHFENAAFRPKGWKHIASSSYATATYTVHTEGGHSDGYITSVQYGTYFSSFYNNYSYIDLLVTPKVQGEVSLWVRSAGADPSLTFYSLTAPNTAPSTSSKAVLIEGTDINMVKDKDIAEWTQITVPNVPAGSYIGIRAHNLDLDEFTATTADVTYVAGLSGDVTRISPTTLEADADNKVTIEFKVALENVGDIDFPASDEGFTVKLFNASNDNMLFGEGKITEAIPFGVKVEKEFAMTGEAILAPNTTSNNFKVQISHERLSEPVETSLAWFTLVPYAPVANLMLGENNDANASSYNNVDAADIITIGAGPAGTSRTLWMWNSGTAPMNITSVAIDGDFAADTEAFTLDAKTKKAIRISLTGDAGRKEGTITFTDATLGQFSYSLLGLVTGDGDYAEDFEEGTTPAGMILGKSWAIKDTPAALQALGGTKYAEQSSTYTTSQLITPLLTFGEGDKLHFMATKTDNTSSVLKVYTSPDRVDWTLAATIDTKDATDAAFRFGTDKPTGTGYGTYEFKIFSADMPEGDCYVAFECGGARLDNIHGGKLKPVAHDIYVTDLSLPDGANVNTRYISSIAVRNLLATPETDYSITLEVDGKTEATATPTPELSGEESTVFDLRFTPHTTGTFPAAIVFTSGTDRLVLKAFEIDVQPEKAENIYQVGTVKITTTDPFNVFYPGAQSQIIYTAEMLGMDPGMNITGVSFTGYNTNTVKKHIKVWAENTDATGYDFGDVQAAPQSGMTLVYDSDYEFKPCGDNSAKVYETTMDIPFATPFKYAGESVRLMFDIRDIEGVTEGQNHVFFTVDNSAYDYWNDKYDNRAITNKKEFVEDLDDPDEADWSIYKAGYPVTYFSVAKDVVTVKGTATDDFGAPVADASVTLVSDDILYSAVTDAEGAYSMNVANVNLTYTLTATADGFDTVSKSDVTLDAAEPEAVFDIEFAWTDRTATVSGTVMNSTSATPLAGATVKIDDATATTDADGAYTLTVPDFTAEYTITASMGDEQLHSATITFPAKTLVHDITVAYSGIADIAAASGISVRVEGTTITVTAPAGTPVTVHSAAGLLIGSAVSNGTPVEFCHLMPGIYIAAGRKVAVRP